LTLGGLPPRSRLHSRLANLFPASTAEHLIHDTTVSLLAVRDHP
jgi:hypothetical protein